jgi:hypothetical protein
MARMKFLAESAPIAPCASMDAPPASRRAIEQRLEAAERELRIQFTRIAQLQAQLDLLLATLRSSPDGDHKR